MKKYTERVIKQILSHRTRLIKFAYIENGKLMYGTKSSHLTKTGIRYNKLIRLVNEVSNIREA